MHLIILGSIIFSAFFSGMEVIFVSASKLRFEPGKRLHPVHSRILSAFTRTPEQSIATMLVGYTLSLVVYGVSFSKLVEPVFYRFVNADVVVLLLETVLATLVILITAELLSGTLFRSSPTMILRIFSIPLFLFYFLFYPATRLFIGIYRILQPASLNTGEKKGPEAPVFDSADLEHLIHEQHDHPSVLKENNANGVKLLRNAMDFSKVKLREIMVPRTEMVVLDIDNSSFEDLRQKFIETGYSRILFFKDNIDNIIGYIHHLTIFSNPESIHSVLKKVLIVPETMSASKLLSIFIQQHRSLAVVMDEFGGTSGMVTSEDILEEIFGEIEDEHDTIDWVEKQIGADEYILSARIELDLLNEKYHLRFALDENYETLAGYILFHHESIPKINTVITIDRFRFKILKATNTRIELIHLKILPGKNNQ